ncbi:MAG: hypothetical protein A2126_00040 [Candidatus Woykebacteria bacterium GWB1_45_5]|uniref:Uncharacterized protein n=2 Tax=Candidatus Woykeibacteriota TaxID=1817899 RepID=A0A1G1W1H5_9BACT|nr:MAG: hypothetical protein A2113_04470 [Candidatus Woykebacteria bacterium GWA1_44_8]OGY22496.1 MAG: hypothetical protein A2126_00040 [Candidatus Woykebacteria bacterium GWB1_45_5]
MGAVATKGAPFLPRPRGLRVKRRKLPSDKAIFLRSLGVLSGLRFYFNALYQAAIMALVIGYQYGEIDEGFRSSVRIRKVIPKEPPLIIIHKLPQNKSANRCILAWHWLTCAEAMLTAFFYEIATKPEEFFEVVEENRRAGVLLLLLGRRKRKCGWWKFWKR